MSPAEARRTLADVVGRVDGLLTCPSIIALRAVAACEQMHPLVRLVRQMFHGNLVSLSHTQQPAFLWLYHVMSSSFLEQNWFETIVTLVFHLLF